MKKTLLIGTLLIGTLFASKAQIITADTVIRYSYAGQNSLADTTIYNVAYQIQVKSGNQTVQQTSGRLPGGYKVANTASLTPTQLLANMKAAVVAFLKTL